MIISIHKEDWYADYIIHWKPLDVCNYDCSYCTPSNHRPINVKKLPDVNRLIDAARKIKESIKDKSISINITGGEPFLIPDIHKWLEKLHEYGFRFSIFTNGSMPLKIYEKSLTALQNATLFISFHPETAEVEEILRLAIMFKDKVRELEIRAMLVPSLFEKVDELERKLKEQKIGINKCRIFPLVDKKTGKHNPVFSSSRDLENYGQKDDIDYYSDDEKNYMEALAEDQTAADVKYANIILTTDKDEKIKDSAVSLLTSRRNNFKGWKCGINTKKLVISADGTVKHGICGNTPEIGNIFLQDDLVLFENEFVTCNIEHCMTLDEIMVTKYKT